VVITYFNWNELRLRSNNDITAILCLTYAQTSIYNEVSAKTMMQRLAIHHIPPHLFHRKYFTQYRNLLVCNYRTKEPQSYFKNASFLFLNAPVRDKVVYIKALSMRRLSISANYIPLKYFPEIKPTLFTKVVEDKIIFPLESSI